MPTIRIDDDVYDWLKAQAEPFEDTPNTVLRRLAGFDERPSIIKSGKSINAAEVTSVVDNEDISHSDSKKDLPMYMTGKELAQRWGVNVKQAHYHRDGKWYNHLKYFPSALFDPNGYIIFQTEESYKNSQYLRHGVELNVPGGISTVPNYKKVNK